MENPEEKAILDSWFGIDEILDMCPYCYINHQMTKEQWEVHSEFMHNYLLTVDFDLGFNLEL